MVKSYVGYRVKMAFDPPTSSAAIEALRSAIAEFEWRLNNIKLILPNLSV